MTQLIKSLGDLLELAPLDEADAPGINALLEKYEDQDCDLADAALVHLANPEGISVIFTTDRRHFEVYRLAGGASVTII